MQELRKTVMDSVRHLLFPMQASLRAWEIVAILAEVDKGIWFRLVHGKLEARTYSEGAQFGPGTEPLVRRAGLQNSKRK